MLSFPRVTEMFQFTRFPLPALCVQTGVTPHNGCRVSPFGHPRVVARSAARRGFSQPPTSFFGSSRQGIHRWLLVAWKYRSSTIELMKMLMFAVQFSRASSRPQRPEPAYETHIRTQRPKSEGPIKALPQNETEDGTRRINEPQYRGSDTRPTSQCTNWELPF